MSEVAFSRLMDAISHLQYAMKELGCDGGPERIVLPSIDDFMRLKFLLPPGIVDHYLSTDSLTKKPMHEMTLCGVRIQCEMVRSVNAIDPWWEKHIKESG